MFNAVEEAEQDAVAAVEAAAEGADANEAQVHARPSASSMSETETTTMSDSMRISANILDSSEESVDAYPPTPPYDHVKHGHASTDLQPKMSDFPFNPLNPQIYTVTIEETNEDWEKSADAYDTSDDDFYGNSLVLSRVNLTSHKAISYIKKVSMGDKRTTYESAINVYTGQPSKVPLMQFRTSKKTNPVCSSLLMDGFRSTIAGRKRNR